MKLVNLSTGQIFRCTMMENIDGNINIFSRDRRHIATVPASQAKLIFNESEIPYMGEEKEKVEYKNGSDKLSYKEKAL